MNSIEASPKDTAEDLELKVKQLSINHRAFENKLFELSEKKIKKGICKKIEEWTKFSNSEAQKIHEVYPCANDCYKAEVLDMKRWNVTCPVVMTTPKGNKELKFMKRFRIVLNLVNCDRDTIEVKLWEKDCAVLVRGKTKIYADDEQHFSGCSMKKNAFSFGRKFKLPDKVIIDQVEAKLLADDKLILEFPINKSRKVSSSHDSSDASLHDNTDVSLSLPTDHMVKQAPMVSNPLKCPQNSQKTQSQNLIQPQKKLSKEKDESSSTASSSGSSSSTGKELKVGVPIFRNEDGQRRLYLTLFIGNEFQPADVMVQVLNENRIRITARRQVRKETKTRKFKFSKDYDLSEKIDPFSLRAGFNCENKLVLSAIAKDQLKNDDEDDY